MSLHAKLNSVEFWGFFLLNEKTKLHVKYRSYFAQEITILHIEHVRVYIKHILTWSEGCPQCYVLAVGESAWLCGAWLDIHSCESAMDAM